MSDGCGLRAAGRMLGRGAALLGLLLLAACGGGSDAREEVILPATVSTSGLHPGETPEMRRKINYWAAQHQIPPSLLHRVIQRESDYRAHARNGPYYGLMQILPQTARTMGYQGSPQGLLDADTNLQFAGRYLRGAYLVADGNQEEAVQWYARGYYYEAKRKGLLRETGLKN
ncbi:MAG TPA: lytic transglycosylase domain-containing protein [Paracoccus sp. (in: a-proteobacteria)]|uniref:lytic transglycosylase domain-containing protein n=1 Tax=uncultured Paracoccus sp. TaxID=189685 RepID=UPI0026254413|nr:lytic transglycosylase domain-containing protein [uncultured Paracoccus sp.]HMQ39717.1 lytic transglycosylase domain-containing protein [Paracoccus sp. (in: a-proteobacteria)]HMR34852.1 lytic transglycosylase domain-containing protein [Paracoccus sp. (in: a-proteobacteria)]